MLSADRAIWENTIGAHEAGSPFTDEKMVYVQDENTGYSGNIIFNTSSLGNGGQWASYSEGYIEIPFMINLKSSVDITAANMVNAYQCGLKNGYYQIIDSCGLELNGQNLCQINSGLNMLINYNVLTKFASTELDRLGAILGVLPDTADSYQWIAGVGGNGDGYSNNRNTIAASATPFILRSTANSGFYNRQKATIANDIVTDPLPTSGLTGPLNKDTSQGEGRNHFDNNGVAAAGRIYTWYILATIRLKDLLSYFNEVPLMKGANYRIVITYNSCTTTVTNTTTTAVTATHTQLSGRTNPLLMASFAAGNACTGITAGTLTVSCGVVKSAIADATVPAHFLTSCRLYVPTYKLNPIYEANLLQSRPITTIKYLDYYQFPINAVQPASPFNQLLTNGVPNPRVLLLIPFVNQGSGATVNALNLPTYQTLFDSAPGTTSPDCSITQLSVAVGGQNVWSQPLQYAFSNFLDEFLSINAINGGTTTGLASGQISHFAWLNAYRFYVCNLSRMPSIEKDIPKSVSVSGVNNTKVVVDYAAFVLYERTVNVRTATGEIVI